MALNSTGTVTNIGMQEFNRVYMSSTRRLMLCGAKVSNTDSAGGALTDLEGLQGLTALQGISRPSGDRYFPLEDIASVGYEDDNFVMTVSIKIDKNLIADDTFTRFHEIGIYAQICQNNPVEYANGTTYRFGDVVRRSDGELFRSRVPDNHGISLSNPEAWLKLSYGKDTLTSQRWYPVPGSEGDPFLFYVVSKHEFPLCVGDAVAIVYKLNIAMRRDKNAAEVVYVPPEDVHGFHEVTLAYLENISQAMRLARNEQRIGHVAMKSLGPYVGGRVYQKDSVVSNGNKLWKALEDLDPLRAAKFPNVSEKNTLLAQDDGYTWLWLSNKIINLIDDYDSAKTYANADVVVHNKRVWYMVNFNVCAGKEPGVDMGYGTWGGVSGQKYYWKEIGTERYT